MLIKHVVNRKLTHTAIKCINWISYRSYCTLLNKNYISNEILSTRKISDFNCLPLLTNPYYSKRWQSMKPEEPKKDEPVITSAAKLKKAVAEYGSTVIVFHITISLTSLGLFYVLVDNGLDVAEFLSSFGVGSDNFAKLASNAGTFALAYAIHKVFAPVRIGITLTATPFIVRYFRNIGWLKN